MDEYSVNTDIVVFAYDRSQKFSKVIEVIEEVEPPTLYVIGDGEDSGTHQQGFQKTRDIISQLEERLNVETELAKKNLGIRERFSSGLNWVFDNTSEAIILEDDTVPSLSFFKYCDVLLDKFRGDSRVMEISGRNQLETWEQGGFDYHFSNFGGIWGWATWREAWKEYDKSMSLWESDVVKQRVRDVICDDEQYQYQKEVFDKTMRGEIDTWDYQWGFAKNKNNGLSVIPSKNLVENIGFDETATHTKNTNHGFANKDTFELSFPLDHPPFIAPDRDYDSQFHDLRKGRSLPSRFIDKLRW